MKRLFTVLLLVLPTLGMQAQTRMPAKGEPVKTMLPDVTFTGKTDKRAEWLKSVASHIPLKGRIPFYDTVVHFKGIFSRDDMDHNAEYYFRKMFSSKSLKLDEGGHNFTGYGVYVFSSDRKNAFCNMYKVYYTLDISIKNGHYSVEMHDFKLENQHSEVSFEHLMTLAKDNDSKAKEILAQFHNNNEYEMKRIYGAMSSKENLSRVTAFVR